MARFSLIFVFVCCGSLACAQITSTFDTDADGWTFFDSSTPITVNHQPSNGNPGGFVSVTYSSSISTTIESWFAPSKFLGNLVVRSFARDLKFDLQQSMAGTGSSASIAEVRIEQGSNVLIYQLPVKPAVAPAWSSYSIKLDETGGWKWSSTTGANATVAQIIQVLTNVTSIEIRGTYGTNTSYTSGLDNVIIEQNTLSVPPSISSLSITSGNPGTSLTIDGTNFDAIPANNAVYFGGVAGTIAAASPTQLTVTVPQGAQYGKVTVVNKITGLTSTSSNSFIPTFTGGGRIIPASFKPKIDFPLDPTAGNELNGLAVADLDGDGWNDVIATENTPASVSIFRNLGAGGIISTASFSPKIVLSGGGASSAVFIVDLDGDGKLDIVAGNSTTFATFRNTSTPGTISFESAENWLMSASGYLSNIVDVDGDGRLDLIGQHGNGSVTVDFWITQNISSPGNILFAASVSYFGGATLDAGAGVQAGDLDNDGDDDLIVEHSFGNLFSIIKNNSTPGTISLETPVQFSEPVSGGVQITDINLDGKNDLIWKRGSSNDDIRVRINTHTSGSFTTTDFATQIIFDSELLNYGGVNLGDFNGDGKPDILASDSRQFGIFENRFSGGAFDANAFVKAFVIEASGISTYPNAPLAADLNGDQKPEIILGITNTNPVRFLIYENSNVHAPSISVNTVSPLSGNIGSTVTMTGSNFSAVLADNDVFFGAVKATVLTATPTELTVSVPPGATYAPVSVRVGELTSRYYLPFIPTFSAGVNFDNSHFAPPVSFTLTGANYDIEVMDIDRDGLADIVAEGGSLISYFFRNTHSAGSISSSSLTAAGATANSASNPRVVDCNGDGLADIVAPNGLSYQNLSTSGSIVFGPQTSLGLGDSNIDWGDLNNDGKLDLAIAAGGSAQLRVMENRSRVSSFTPAGIYGTFADDVAIPKASTQGGIVVADLDGDGHTDVAVTNPGTDNISIFRNLGNLRVNTIMFAPRIDLTTGDNPGRIYSGDFDRDGKIDLLLYHSTGTTVTQLTIFHNQSTPGNISLNRVDLTNPSATTVATIADLDGDGKPEIITTSESGNRFSIFKNIHTAGALSAASFAAPFNTTITAPRGLSTGDLNLDGKPEIIITRAAGLLVVYENLVASATSNALDFDGGDDWVQVGNQPAVNLTNTITLEAWVKPNASQPTTFPRIIDKYTWNVGGYVLNLNNTSGLSFDFWAIDGTRQLVGVSGLSLFDGQWHHVAATYDGNAMRIYFDFCEVASSTIGNKLINPTVNPLRIGGNTDGTTFWWYRGGIANPRVWNVARTQNELIAGSGGVSSTEPGLVVDYGFREGTGFTTADSSPNNLTAILGNTPAPNTQAPAWLFSEVFPSAPSPPSIISFTPTGGFVGDPVTIEGANFSTTPANNTVTFNGTSAVVIGSTSTTLSTTVPVGATTGPITVSIGCFTTQSASNFILTTNTITITSQPGGTTNRCEGDSYPFSTDATGTTNITYQWQKFNTLSSLFENLVNGGAFTDVTTKNLQINNMQLTESGDYRCMIEGDFAAIVYSDTATLIVNPIPTAPSTVDGSRCGPGQVLVSASNGAPGDYRWYAGMAGGEPIENEENDTYLTPSLTTTTTYYATLVNAFCESARIPVNAIINSIPPKPVITSSITPVGNVVTLCSTSSLTLTAPAGYNSYAWSTGETTEQIFVTLAGTYSVFVTDAAGCSSPHADALTVTIIPAPCNNQAPVITSTVSAVPIEGVVTIDVLNLISDPDDNLDIFSLTVVTPTSQQGAAASINASSQLVLDYAGVLFSGIDRVTIQVCDLFGECTQQELTIEVSGDIVIYNAFSPNTDDTVNPVFVLRYIDLLPDTQNNRVTIYNRWGDEVFSITNYNNTDRVFRGESNSGNELPSGTYFYKIEFNSGRKMKTGYLSLKR